MTRDEILKLFPDATDEAISKLLNAHHNEINAARKQDADAAEKAAKSDAQAAEIVALQKQIEKLTADNAAARKANNVASALAALTKAGMDEALAKTIIDSAVTDDAKASTARIDALVTAYSAAEQARANALAQQGLKDMPKPMGGGDKPDTSVEFAKRLAETKAIHSTSGTLDAFKQS